MLKHQLKIFFIFWLCHWSLQKTLDFNNVDRLIAEGNVIDQTVQMVKDGIKDLKISDKDQNVFVLGNLGAGKTTLSLLLTADDRKLISKDIGGDADPMGVYYIVDKTGLIEDDKMRDDRTIRKRTIVPHLLMDHENGVGIYDFPGFDDTRETTNDIVSSFLSKECLDRTKSAKFVFVISYEAVKMGGGRSEFLKLLENISRFMKNIDKYGDAVGMVVNKVDAHDKTDDVVMRAIVQYLRHIKSMLEKNINEKVFYRDGVKFIDMVLRKGGDDNDKYDRITLLRSPDRAGPLNEIEIIQHSKKNIKHMIHKVLRFVEQSSNKKDFMCGVNERSLTVVHDVIMATDRDIVNKVSDINTDIETTFEVENLKHIINDVRGDLKDMIDNKENVNTPKKFYYRMEKMIQKFKITLMEKHLDRLDDMVRFINFMKSLTTDTVNVEVTDWVTHLQGGLTTLNNFYHVLDTKNTHVV